MAVLERKNDNVEINGAVCESGFNIMASAEAFEILSDRIYPNKIKAVVRELSTNAVDATIDARKVSKIHLALSNNPLILDEELMERVNDNLQYVQKERDIFNENFSYDLSNWVEHPPLVHLPNKIEPFFSIRDYGTGLSHEFIMKLYTTYFWSDKKTSNDYTGCLGLGSKSPFAYTDHFTVTSFWNGEKRIYNAHLDNGFPAISTFVDEETGAEMVYPTDESNGIEVQFAVKSTDFDEFALEARKLYPYFKMQPKVVGNSSVSQFLDDVLESKKNDTYYSLSNDKTINWGFRVNVGHGPQAIMGNIAYPIALNNRYSYDGIIQSLLNSNIDIEFPVGALQITPSREQLSYKQSTIQAIENAFKQIAEEIAFKINEQIQNEDSLWLARCRVYELFHQGDFVGFSNLLSLNKLQWKGQDIGSTLHINLEKETGITIWRFEPHGRSKKVRVNNLPLNRNIRLFEIDLPRGSFTRLEIESGNSGKHVYAVEFVNRTAYDSLINKMGMPANTVLTGTSTLPKPTAGKRASYSSDANIFTYNKTGWMRRYYQHWRKVGPEFDLTAGGVYVEMFRYQILDKNDQQIQPEKIKDLLDILEELGENVNPVIGVRKKMVKQFVRSDDWVDLHTYCEKFINQQIVTNKIDVKIADHQHINNIAHKNMFMQLLDHLENINDGKIKEFLTKFMEVQFSGHSIIKHWRKYVDLALKVGISLDAKPTHNLTSEIDSIMGIYPLLAYVSDSDIAVSNSVVDYINSIDKA